MGENVISWNVENVITIFLMTVVGWLVLTFIQGYLENRGA